MKNCIEKKTPKTIVGYKDLQPIKIEALMYADDIVLIADKAKKMQKLIDIWTSEVEAMGMTINESKTKTMQIQRNNGNNTQDFTCKGKKLESVTNFEYLGTIISSDGRIEPEIANKIKKATNIYYAINRTLLGKKEIGKKTKLQIYNTVVIPAMTYTIEVLPTLIEHKRKITTIEMKYLRKIQGVTKLDRWRNEALYKELKQEPVTTKIEKKQLAWFGHVSRMNPDRKTKQFLSAKPTGKKTAGRPRKTLNNIIEEIAEKLDTTQDQMKELAANRKNWKSWITSKYPTP